MKVFLSALADQFRRLIREEDGLSTVEYAVAGGVIAAAVATAFTSLGTAVSTKIGAISTALAG